MAAKIGRAPESISNIERGAQSPTVDTLVDIAEALGLPVLELMGRKTVNDNRTGVRMKAEARLWDAVRLMSDVQLTLLVAHAQAILEVLNTISERQPKRD